MSKSYLVIYDSMLNVSQKRRKKRSKRRCGDGGAGHHSNANRIKHLFKAISSEYKNLPFRHQNTINMPVPRTDTSIPPKRKRTNRGREQRQTK